ncbi:MAG: DUF6290 family protein [Neisseriaceae bacterium]|jgi:RHH-type rel operon transcriptional repressor/antitoxin RelB
MLSIRVSNDIEKRLEHLAKETGRTKSFYVKKALMEYLEDMEDIYLAEKAIEEIKSGRSGTIKWEDLKKELALWGCKKEPSKRLS